MAESTTTPPPGTGSWPRETVGQEAARGIRAIERVLASHAAFEAWCQEHRKRYGREPGETIDP